MSAPGWITAACRLLQQQAALVRVTIASVRGSSPRESGATMLVTARSQWGTIGGGQLEWQASERAQRWLQEDPSARAQVIDLRLGPDLAQCCGGAVVLWFECITRDACAELEQFAFHCAVETGTGLRTRFSSGHLERTLLAASASVVCSLQRSDGVIELLEREPGPELPLWIFGAGHVGRAVVRLLDELPQFGVLWLDSRDGLLPATATHIHGQILAEPVERIAQAPPGTAFLVLTHDHELDYQLCSAVLKRGDAAWLGLIGSQSKAARFRSRLRRDGFSDARVSSLCSPVGQANLRSKLPAAIAVSIVAQLLTLEARAARACAVSACDPACRRCATPLLSTELP